MRVPGLIAVALAMLMSACQSTPEPPPNPLDQELNDITVLMQGDYFSDAEGGAREGRTIYMRVRAIIPPAGRGHALYSEMRHDGPEGDVYRQVIYLFDETPTRSENRMSALRVSDELAAAQLLTNPSAFAHGAVETVEALSENCYAVLSKIEAGYESWIDPERCIITGRRGDQRRIEVRTRITPQHIGQLERGYTIERELLFGNPDGNLYIWPRIEPSSSD